MNDSNLFDSIIVGVVLAIVIVLVILRFKCPQLFKKPKTPDKCEKCGKSEFLPVYSKTQKVNTEWSGRFAIGGPVAFKCKSCGNEIQVKKGEGFFTSGDLRKPHV